MSTYRVALVVTADTPDQLHELLRHLIEWSNNAVVVTSVREAVPSDPR